MLAIACTLLLVDQVAKALAVAYLTQGSPVPLLGGLLTLDLLRNPGAAFSLGTQATWVFSVLAAVALTLLIVLALPRVRVRWWCVAVGMFMAGIAGNLVDRLVRSPAFGRGHVIDFLELPNWPVFNVADMCITGGAVVVIVVATFGKLNHDGRRREDLEQERRRGSRRRSGEDEDR